MTSNLFNRNANDPEVQKYVSLYIEARELDRQASQQADLEKAETIKRSKEVWSQTHKLKTQLKTTGYTIPVIRGILRQRRSRLS